MWRWPFVNHLFFLCVVYCASGSVSAVHNPSDADGAHVKITGDCLHRGVLHQSSVQEECDHVVTGQYTHVGEAPTLIPLHCGTDQGNDRNKVVGELPTAHIKARRAMRWHELVVRCIQFVGEETHITQLSKHPVR